MRKARLYYSSMEHYFMKVYKCPPETYFDRLCATMPSQAAAEEVNRLMDGIWETMKAENTALQGLAALGFSAVAEEDTPFADTATPT